MDEDLPHGYFFAQATPPFCALFMAPIPRSRGFDGTNDPHDPRGVTLCSQER
jgi:hypothetical protein